MRLSWFVDSGPIQTGIPIGQSVALNRHEPSRTCYTLHSIVATSYQPNGMGEIEFCIRRPDDTPIVPQEATALTGWAGRVVMSLSGQANHHSDEPSMFNIRFRLGDHEYSFSNRALEIVKKSLKELGIEDTKNTMLSSFKSDLATFVQVHDEWIPIDNWIRIKNDLPYERQTVTPKKMERFKSMV